MFLDFVVQIRWYLRKYKFFNKEKIDEMYNIDWVLDWCHLLFHFQQFVPGF